MVLNEQVIDAVHRDTCDQRVFICCVNLMFRCRKYLFMTCSPSMRHHLAGRSTDRDRVSKEMRLIYGKNQAVQTIALMDTRQHVTVLTARPERIHDRVVFTGLLIKPDMTP